MCAEPDPTALPRGPRGPEISPIEGIERVSHVEETTLSRGALRELLGRLRDPLASGVATNDVARTPELGTLFVESADNIYRDEFRSDEPGGSAPFLSVILIVGDASDATVSDALVALDAQCFSDFELIVVAPSPNDLDRVHFEEMIAPYSSGLAKRSRVVAEPAQPLAPRTRVGWLRAGVTEARGRYITVLDGTSVVFAHFVATFARLAHGSSAAVLRARAVSQPMHPLIWPDGHDGFEPTSGAAPASAPHFSALEHLLVPRTPPGSFALLSNYFRDDDVDIDENETLVEAAILGGVHESPDDVIVLLRRFDSGDLDVGRRTS